VLAHGTPFAYFDGLNRFYIRVTTKNCVRRSRTALRCSNRFALSGRDSTYASRLRIEGEARPSRRGAKARSGRFRASRARRKPTNGAALRPHAAMEATISGALPAPLRWLSVSETRKCAQRALIARRRGVAFARSYPSPGPKRLVLENRAVLRSRYPRLWQRAKRVRLPRRRGVTRLKQALCCVVATRRWVRARREIYHCWSAEIERLLRSKSSSGATCDCPRPHSGAVRTATRRASRGRSPRDARCRAIERPCGSSSMCIQADRGVRTPGRRTVLRSLAIHIARQRGDDEVRNLSKRCVSGHDPNRQRLRCSPRSVENTSVSASTHDRQPKLRCIAEDDTLVREALIPAPLDDGRSARFARLSKTLVRLPWYRVRARNSRRCVLVHRSTISSIAFPRALSCDRRSKAWISRQARILRDCDHLLAISETSRLDAIELSPLLASALPRFGRRR